MSLRLTALLSFIGIVLGALLVLMGLLMIAPQVRVHQIKVYSRGSWVYRIGIALSVIGLIVLPLSDGINELAQVGLVTGVAGLMGGIITWNHELHQARNAGDIPWDWPHSLTLQMIVMSAAVIVLALVLCYHSPLSKILTTTTTSWKHRAACILMPSSCPDSFWAW